MKIMRIDVLLICSLHVGLQQSLAIDASAIALRGRGATAIEAFADAEADSEMGQDLGLDLVAETTSSSTSDPATLEAYCAGPTPQEEQGKLKKGVKVEANWKDYGTMYPGTIKDENSDGTVDVAYDDGFTEKRVPAGHVKVKKDQGKEDEAAPKEKAKPRDDPACKLQDFLKKMQTQLEGLNEMISKWLAGQRAKMSGAEMPQPPTSVTAAPPKEAPAGITGAAPAPASAEEADKLEKYKQELADLDAYIKELEAQEEKNDKDLQAKVAPNAAPAPAPGVKTVDDLIAEYKAKIAQRQDRVKELLQRIKEQEAELAHLGEGLSLSDIEEAVTQLEKDVEEGKAKRDELKKAGELDPELRAVIDDIIDALAKLRKKVDNLTALEAKAKAARAKAEEEAKEDIEAARKKAKEEGRDEDEAAAEAAAAAKKKANDKAREAELASMEAAGDIEKDLKKAEEGATKLDTGLHPHGDKWWRYRYERSYIEALLMIFISSLMLLWSGFWRRMKHYIHQRSLPPNRAPTTEWDELIEEAHSTILISWLHSLADQMLVCIFVFLTIWLIAKTPLVQVFPMMIKPAPDMHVPRTAEEYQHMALDITTIYFFSIAMYFALMFSVAHEIRRTTLDLENIEDQARSGGASKTPTNTRASVAAMGTSFTRSAEHFANTQKHFVTHIGEQLKIRDDPALKEISKLVNDDMNNFPLNQYLKVNVRMTGSELFLFSYRMWLPTICLFVCLCILHRFAHMGYVRIMGVAAVFVLVLIVGMGYVTKQLTRNIEEYGESNDKEIKLQIKKSIHERWPTELIVMSILEFSLFFVCYGTARMICQPWMWELHFWPVLILSIVAVLSAALFVLIVAPGIPSFLCATALPPYVDDTNMAIMKACAIEYSKSPRTTQ